MRVKAIEPDPRARREENWRRNRCEDRRKIAFFTITTMTELTVADS
jgi:hypothetical protein